MTVKKRRDNATDSVFLHKVADIRGGVAVAASELGGDYLREGAVLSAPDNNGLTHVVKIAVAAAAVEATGTKISVKKNHNFKAGDFIMTAAGQTAVAISSIDETGKTTDVITVGAAVGAIAIGDTLLEAKAAGASGELKYTPQSVNGTGKPFDPQSNINTDAWVIGVTKGNPVPAAIAAELPGIINL